MKKEFPVVISSGDEVSVQCFASWLSVRKCKTENNMAKIANLLGLALHFATDNQLAKPCSVLAVHYL